MPTDKVHIEEPCSVKWNSMAPHPEGKFCGSCQTPVVDFTRYSADEIRLYFQEKKDRHVCGLYHARHTTHSGTWLNRVNALERRLHRPGLKRLSMLLVAALLFFSNCARRKVQGRIMYKTDDPKKVTVVPRSSAKGV